MTAATHTLVRMPARCPAGRSSKRHRTELLQLAVVMLAEMIGVAAGLYIGTLT